MTTDLQQKKKPEHISQHLQDLIDSANNSIQTIKEQILEIYETAKKEGFTPFEARIMIEEKVISVSDRHLRRILPDESKRTYIKSDNSDPGPKLENSQENNENVVNISTAYDVKEAETEHDLPEPIQELPDDDNGGTDVIIDPSLLDQKIKEIARLEEEVTRLKIQKVGTYGNKFDFDYDLEVKDQILPLIVTAFPDKKTGYVRLDKKRLEKKK